MTTMSQTFYTEKLGKASCYFCREVLQALEKSKIAHEVDMFVYLAVPTRLTSYSQYTQFCLCTITIKDAKEQRLLQLSNSLFLIISAVALRWGGSFPYSSTLSVQNLSLEDGCLEANRKGLVRSPEGEERQKCQVEGAIKQESSKGYRKKQRV